MAFWIMLFTFLIAVFVTPIVANAWLAGRRLTVIRAAVERGHPFDAALLDSSTVRAWRLHPRLFVIAGVLSLFIGAGYVGMAFVLMPNSLGKHVFAQAFIWFALGIGLFVAHFVKGRSEPAAP